ncbi:MAG TPA: hypothetical protein VKA34_13490 [Balneolales bacterium]|nr:hypothetical protein [Balneolales bacterium]
MQRRYLFLVILLLLGTTCKRKISENNTSNPQHISVLTQHNNNTRDGWNDHETLLNTTNVSEKQFGRQFTLLVDDQVYAQPLVAGNLYIDNGLHNVVYVATVNNSLYAFDGDTGKLYWNRNYTEPGMHPPRNTDLNGACGGHYTDFSLNIGIVGTPVIDAKTKTIYFVTRSTDGTIFEQHLHAVNIMNGNEESGSPVKIDATVSGNGAGTSDNVISFDPERQNQRQALTLVNGIVYVTYSSHCDWGPFHGWILGYNAATLKQDIVYNDTPDGYDGGLWESGMGMAADGQGNLYDVAGNGSVGLNGNPANPTNRAESAMKLRPSGSTFTVESYFTPFSYKQLNHGDLDYGGMGAFLIPNSNYYLTGGKDGYLYLLNKDNMGGYQSSSNNIQQTVFLDSTANLHSQPAYYKGSSKAFIYVWSENDKFRAIPYNSDSYLLEKNNEIVSNVNGPHGQNGANISVSSDGSKDGTGIVWVTYAASGDAEHSVSPGILRAFDANDVSKELWNNHQNRSRDDAGNFAKFASPTIANGHVYLPTFSNQVVVYGLLKQ